MRLNVRSLVGSAGFVVPLLAGCVDGSRGDTLAQALDANWSSAGATSEDTPSPVVVLPTSDIGLRPEVHGRVVRVLVRAGDVVAEGSPLLEIDSTPSRERSTELGDAIVFECRDLEQEPSMRDVAEACVRLVEAVSGSTSADDALPGERRRCERHPDRVRCAAFDGAVAAAHVAAADRVMAERRFRDRAKRAGIGVYGARVRTLTDRMDVYLLSTAPLGHYVLEAPAAGTVETMYAAVGDEVSPEGLYDSYIGRYVAVVSMRVKGTPDRLAGERGAGASKDDM